MKKEKPTLRAACAQYVHRFTMEHVPAWAREQAPNGKYYAPQYTSDKEWYDNTAFTPDSGHRDSCMSSGQTWPLGKWLDEPFRRKA